MKISINTPLVNKSFVRPPITFVEGKAILISKKLRTINLDELYLE